MRRDDADEERESLIQGYVEGQLTPPECARLSELLRKDPTLAHAILDNLVANDAIREVVAEKGETSFAPPPLPTTPSPGAKDTPAAPPGQVTRSRSWRRLHGSGGSPRALAIFGAAAAVLLVVLVVGGLSSSKRSDPPRLVGPSKPMPREPGPEAPPPAPKAPDPAEKEKPKIAGPDEERRRPETEKKEFGDPERKLPESIPRTPEDKPNTPPRTPPPPPSTQDKVAVVVEQVEGTAHVPGGPRLKAGDRLPDGRGIETTGASGRVVAKFADGTTLELVGHTSISEVSEAAPPARGKRVVVSQGVVSAEVAKQPPGQPMVFVTPHGEATVLGTSLRLIVDPEAKGSTGLEVKEGLVQLRRKLDGKTVDVPSGHYSVAGVGGEFAARQAPPEVITVNFGPDVMKELLPKGTLNDSGQEFDAGRGYGWLGPAVTPDGIKRSVSFSQGAIDKYGPLKGSFVYGGNRDRTQTWSMSVPNGRYHVTVCVGEFGYVQGPHQVRVEDRTVINALMTRPGEYVEVSGEVTVRDGDLTVVIGGHKTSRLPPDKSDDTVMNYLSVKRLPEGPQKKK